MSEDEKGFLLCTVSMLVLIGMFIYFGISLTSGAYDEITSGIRTHDVGYWEQEICQYHDCGNEAKKEISFRTYSNLNRVLNFDNNADFNVETDNFSYTPTEKHIGREKGTYLVPQGDGSLKVEKRTYLYEYETKGKTVTSTFAEVKGFYCEEHADIAIETLKQDLKAAMVTKNPSFWIFVIILPTVVVIAGIVAIVVIAKKQKMWAK